MALRNTPSGKNFHYTKTSPENVLSAKKGAMFFRTGSAFYINRSGNLSSNWERLNMRTVIVPYPDVNSMLQYEHKCDLWFKASDGLYNQFAELLPKTNWMFVSHKNPFVDIGTARKFSWKFPVPTGSFDFTTGDSNDLRSVDKNFFYAKINYVWYRTPITTFNFNFESNNINDVYYTTLPFVDKPTSSLPTDTNSNVGDVYQQAMDDEAFYVRVNGDWRRCLFTMFEDPHKMAMF